MPFAHEEKLENSGLFEQTIATISLLLLHQINFVMKAIVYDAPRKFQYRDIAVPKIQPDEILLRVHACGVCGTAVWGHVRTRLYEGVRYVRVSRKGVHKNCLRDSEHCAGVRSR